MANQQFYKRIKVLGLILFIPLFMAAGPMAGYWLGDFLQSKFKLPAYILFICIGLGFFSSIIEVVRIIRLILKIDR